MRSARSSVAGKTTEIAATSSGSDGSRYAASSSTSVTMRSGESSVCYLLSREVQEALNLVGKHEHLWRLLLAHQRDHHADRHLATHVAHVMRLAVARA